MGLNPLNGQDRQAAEDARSVDSDGSPPAWPCQAFLIGRHQTIDWGGVMMNKILLKLRPALPACVLLALFVLMIVFVNHTAPQSLPGDPLEQVKKYIRADMRREADAVYRKLVESHPDNIDYHYRYIRNHYLIRSRPGQSVDHSALLDYYSALASTEDYADLGRYALGLIAFLNQADEQALGYYASVADRDQKYLNYSLGQLYRQRGEIRRAEGYLRREIELNGDLDEAVPGLANLYLEQGDLPKLYALVEDTRLKPYLDPGILRKLAFQRQDWEAYLQATFISLYRAVNPLGAGTALIIGLTWLLYFVRLSVFNRKPFWLYLAALCLGAVFANASLILSDLFAEYFSIYLADERLRLLAMSMINIGLVEEIAKFLPVLIVIRLARRLDEPFELLAYGCLSALGFATLENVFYISRSGLNIALGRFLISCVIHIAMTAIVCYFWARARTFRPGSQLKAVLLGLALAAILHGLFDYFMMGVLGNLLVASYAMAFLMAREVQRMLSNALNQSPACAGSPAAPLRMSNFGLFLSASLTIFLIVYLSYYAGLSTHIANQQAPLVGLVNLPGFIVVFGSLGRLTLAPGKVIPLNNFGLHRPLKRWLVRERYEPA